MNDGRTLIEALARQYAAREHARLSDAHDEVSLHFAARHPSVGEAAVFAAKSPGHPGVAKVAAWVSVGRLLTRYQFADYDTHRALSDRWNRLTQDVNRFLGRLFEDRLLLWVSDDHQVQGWREGADEDVIDEPLVADDRTYALYVWSGPLGKWRTTDIVLARRTVASEQERLLVRERLQPDAPHPFEPAEARLALRLVEAYERRVGDGTLDG